jgi:predicted transposase YdaD
LPYPFDATLKDLAQANPHEFLAALAVLPPLPVALLNVDLSTVSTTADLVFGVGNPLTEVVHVDCQSSAAEDLHRDVLVFNALLHRRYRVPVHSIVLLLRPRARHRNVNGNVRYQALPGRGKMEFSYEVIELWLHPADALLAGGLSTVPLAVLGQLPQTLSLEDGLAGVIQRLVERVGREAPPQQAKKLLTAAFLLSGLRVDRALARELFRGVRAMRDSDTYQAILDEGEVKGLQRAVLRMGRKRLGEPGDEAQAAVRAITDVERLERLIERGLDATSWRELLAIP